MNVEVRSDYTDGKLLFEWDPSENVIGIVEKGTFYRIKLIQQGGIGKYRVIEKHPKVMEYHAHRKHPKK